jgi:hypothetical protein
MVLDRNSDAWMPPSLIKWSGAFSKIALVPSMPPGVGDASSTITRSPARARYAAAVRPLWPAPMTMTS